VRILGISAYYHDSAAALLEDGRVVAAAREERFTRRKHDAAFPHNALAYCLGQGASNLNDVDFVVFYEKPWIKFERLLETYLSLAPRGLHSFAKAIPLWTREKLFHRQLLKAALAPHGSNFDCDCRLLFSEHHLSHAASAFFASPFSKALILTLDGVGEWTTTSVALGRDNSIEMLREIHFPHSLGLLYSAFTEYLGFRVNSGEYKVMGLAPYGSPAYAQRIRDNLLEQRPDGSFWLDQSYFDYCGGLRMTGRRFHDLFGGPRREPGEQLTQRHMDIAASVQSVLDEAVLCLVRSLVNETRERNICLAGGVALNCVTNGKLLRSGCIDRLWVQPAADVAGAALGAALVAYHITERRPRPFPIPGDFMEGTLLGPSFSPEEIQTRLVRLGANFHVLDESELLTASVDVVERGGTLGWFQGRMEFGPRALGGRSILADARRPEMQSILNLKIKHREGFRPFAPSVLKEHAHDWFELEVDSPYMSLVAGVHSKRRRRVSPEWEKLTGFDKMKVPLSSIPAVTHVDYSARIQTVGEEAHPLYRRLLQTFYQRTGCPVLLNTSFNVRGEPIVCSPEDAFQCFLATDLDALAIGDAFLLKDEQATPARPEYAMTFAED
jgi:carbamoyltransferase